MDETKQANPPDATTTANDDTGAQNTARHAEATSSDTLSELQDTQTDSAASQSGASESSDSSSAPSPDGMPDNTGGGTADGKDSGGPM
ncbi:MAG TPA: hypothetical protein VEX70_11595 [Pyrinomonadaceae bacterium]|nr:hypothetical protein [Pyrinomonadaceae bacterium]